MHEVLAGGNGPKPLSELTNADFTGRAGVFVLLRQGTRGRLESCMTSYVMFGDLSFLENVLRCVERTRTTTGASATQVWWIHCAWQEQRELQQRVLRAQTDGSLDFG